jgi:hypothetical protein
MKEEEGIRSWSKTTYPVLKELLFLNIHFKSRLIILDLMAYDFLFSPLTSPSIFFCFTPCRPGLLSRSGCKWKKNLARL